MSINYNNDYSYADAKLSDTVVYYDNKPVYIDHVQLDEGDVHYRFLGTNKWLNNHLNKFNLEPVKLGNINFDEEDFAYFSRAPVRAWKQGLRLNNLRVCGARTHKDFDRSTVKGINFHLDSPSLINCIINRYPTIYECLEKLICNERRGMSFSRNFGIRRHKENTFLIFRNLIVGKVNLQKNQPEFNLREEYSYLTELFNEEKRE